MRPFGRARSPSPGTALSHTTASRPSAVVKARALTDIEAMLPTRLTPADLT